MRYNVFISYANNDKDIVENLREKFNDIGINAWVYSRDSTLGKEMWIEIESKLKECDVVIFVISDSTPNAIGQQNEIELVFEKIESINSALIPLFIDEPNSSNCPELLRRINGGFLNADNVKTIVRKIASHAFPALFKQESGQPWNYPIPGEWLEVSNLDEMVEELFDIGDKLYFRAVSPIGLFECYSPKIKELFWIAPQNVKHSLGISNDQELEKLVPYTYTVGGMVDIQMRGWNEWRVSHNKE